MIAVVSKRPGGAQRCGAELELVDESEHRMGCCYQNAERIFIIEIIDI